MRIRRRIAGLVLLVVAAVSWSAAPAQAQDDEARIEGSWTVDLEIVESQLPEGLALLPGTRTYRFGDGCTLGAPCEMVRVSTTGDEIPTTLTSSGGGWSWSDSEKLDCVDTVTGELRVPAGFDYTTSAVLTPTDFVERDGVRYVSAMSGTQTAVAEVNAAGATQDCLIRPPESGLPRAEDTGSLTGTPVPLDDIPLDLPREPVGVTPVAEAVTRAQQVDGFTLPLSPEQREARRAVLRGDRSSVPGALVPPADAGGSGSHLLRSLLLATLLGLLMVFPAQLFNSTYEENHERIDAVIHKLPWRRAGVPVAVAAPVLAGTDPEVFAESVEPWTEPASSPPPDAAAGAGASATSPAPAVDPRAGRARRGLVFTLVVGAGALIGGFLDPKFGFETASYALLVGVFVAVLAAVFVSALAARTYRQTGKRDTSWILHAIPSGLIVAVVCVLISRLVKFEPGYLYGLVGGATFLAAVGRKEEGRSEVWVIVAGLVVAFAAWGVFGTVGASASEPGAGFGVLVADALLAGLFIGGIEGLLFGLVPLRFLPGYRVKGWTWAAWIVLTAIVTFTFVHVLLNPESGYLGRSTQASVTLTYVLFACFGVASVAFWGYFRLRPTPDEDGAPPGDDSSPAGAPEVPGPDDPTLVAPLPVGGDDPTVVLPPPTGTEPAGADPEGER